MSTPGFMVTTRIDGAHKTMPTYPLLPDDLLVREADGTFHKECPGISVGGFTLTDEQIADLKPVEFIARGLDYSVLP